MVEAADAAAASVSGRTRQDLDSDHAYFQIDADTVWETVTDELPALRDAVQAALDAG
jgi:uncharacterized protein with HEPN domain